MIRTNLRLLLALTLALLLHLLPFLPELLRDSHPPPPPPPASPPLDARLRPPPLPEQPPLRIEEPPPKAAASKTPPLPRLKSPRSTVATSWQEAVRQQLQRRQKLGIFYPPEAISRGLEGEALVLMILDPSGQIVASRIEQSSGHPILDEAALQNVRALSSIPADAPREIVLPVRFRLR